MQHEASQRFELHDLVGCERCHHRGIVDGDAILSFAEPRAEDSSVVIVRAFVDGLAKHAGLVLRLGTGNLSRNPKLEAAIAPEI